jgi:predicted nucleotidyltransferase
MSIDAADLRILDLVDQACAQIGVEWMLVGALARDVHLIEIAGIIPSRATIDIDIAVAVGSWETFDAIKELLINSSNFAPDSNFQRVRGLGALAGRQLDIVPFGAGLRDSSGVIRWPPDAAVVMSVAGFEEAYASSIEYQVDAQRFRLASVPGLAALKLIAWKDRHHLTTKDAIDFAELLSTYEHVVGSNKMYEEQIGLLDDNDFDPRLAAAWLLGADIRSIAAPNTMTEAITVLDNADFLNDVLIGARLDATTLEVLLEKCRDGLRTDHTRRN